MSTAKTFKKGEYLFKDGDKITGLLLIQSGGVTLGLTRNKKMVEIAQLGSSQVLGEQSLLGATTFNVSAIATVETKVLEVPIDIFKQAIEGLPQPIKIFIKSLNERLKNANADVRAGKLEKDSSPAPEEQIARIFGTVFHCARQKGVKDEKNQGRITVDWLSMKQYAQRVFGDSPKRMEQAICVLVKLKIAQFEMGRPPDDPEGAEQIMKVHFFDLAIVESFFEFYQYHYFKNGKSEILKPEENVILLLNHLVKLGETVPIDRFGLVTLDYTKVSEYFKAEARITLLPDHFSRLENKGIFAKRATRADGSVVLQYELKEYKTTSYIWRMLREIEKWNERGFVDLTEEDSKPKKKTDGSSCPACSAELATGSKFCSDCGLKIAA